MRERGPSPAPSRVWSFNLDAELELAAPGPYQTARRIAEVLAPMRVHAHGLLDTGDTVLAGEAPSQQVSPKPGTDSESQALEPQALASAGAVASCWSPTPSALRRLAAAGVRIPPVPSVEVLRRVTHRSFYLSLGGGAPGAVYVRDAAELDAVLSAAQKGAWLFKKPFGFAGRGQRRIDFSPSADDWRWLGASLRSGGLLAEPWLEIERELSLHGWLEQDGRLRLGALCVQQTNRYRCWMGTSVAHPGDVSDVHASTLRTSTERVGEALARTGYFGPFGIDAYVWRTPSGARELNPLGELNPRYTMGFATGFGKPPRPT